MYLVIIPKLDKQANKHFIHAFAPNFHLTIQQFFWWRCSDNFLPGARYPNA